MVVRTELFEGTDLTCGLAARTGVPPCTRLLLPFLQTDQLPPVEIAVELIERSLALPFVRFRQSRMAGPHSRALFLPDICAGGPPEAFIDGHEFCHLHPPPEYGIHLTLPDDLRRPAIELGWAEQHPVTRLGCMPPTLVLAYAPRNHAEIDPVFGLVRSSYHFARGL